MKQAISDISVVICAYTAERWTELAEGIAALHNQTLPPHEIIVVIDHNAALLERTQHIYGDVIVISNSEQCGLSGARNSGIVASSGAIIAFLDDDATPAADWLEHLRAAYADPEVMGVGGTIVPNWDKQRPIWFPDEYDWVVGCTYRGMPVDTAQVRNLIGANMSFRREVLLALNGFRHGIGRVGKRPLGCEETELCIRARQRWPDRTLWYQPRAIVFHHVPQSRGQWSYFRAPLLRRRFIESIGHTLGWAHRRPGK